MNFNYSELVGEAYTPVWTAAKLFVLLGLLVYVIFALVVVKQVKRMTDTLEVGFETPLKIISYLHLVFALVTFGIALVIL